MTDPADNYVFIEQHTHDHGEVISGPAPPLITIDFPTYNFNSETKELTGIIDFSISDELKIIYGSGGCLSGAAGEGCGTGLDAVYGIPFEKGSFEVLKLEQDGSIIALFLDAVIDLGPGEDWTEEITFKDSVIVEGQLSITRVTRTNRISNHGILKKSDIIIWEWD